MAQLDQAGDIQVESHVYKVIDGVQLSMKSYRKRSGEHSEQTSQGRSFKESAGTLAGKPNGNSAETLAGKPAILFFFGGGWVGGTIDQFEPHSRYFAERGIVAFTADYRVKSRHETTPFESVSDGKSAVQWLQEHADELGIDPERIVVAGGSAGGHVAASTAILRDQPPSLHRMPAALVLFNPVVDTTPAGFGSTTIGERYMELSCTHHITAQLPPTLLFHGTADKTVPFANAEAFRDRMLQHGNRCELVAYEGEGHGFFNFARHREIYEQTVHTASQFLQSLGI